MPKEKLDLDTKNLINDLRFLLHYIDEFTINETLLDRVEKIKEKIREYDYRYEK